MRIERLAAIVLTLPLCVGSAGWDSEFDRLEGDRLARMVAGDGVVPRKSLGLRALDSLPTVFHDTRAAFLIVKTGQGHYARILAAPGLRKPPEGSGAAIPVVVLERF